jgi:amino acid permease
MYKNVLEHIAGIEIYPLISFAIFFLFFLALLGYVCVVSRSHVQAMKQIPLLDDHLAPQPQAEGGALC